MASKARKFYNDAAGDDFEEWDDIDFFDPDEADELEDEEQDSYEEIVAELRQGGLSRRARRALERRGGISKTKTKKEMQRASQRSRKQTGKGVKVRNQKGPRKSNVRGRTRSAGKRRK